MNLLAKVCDFHVRIPVGLLTVPAVLGRAKIRPAPMASLREPTPENSDEDDARSFAIESEFYGDATIASTPGVAARGKQGQLGNSPFTEPTQRFNPFTSKPIAFQPPSQPPITKPVTPTSDYESQSRIARTPMAGAGAELASGDALARPPVTGLLSDPPRRRSRVNDAAYADNGSESESSDGEWAKRARRRGKRSQATSTTPAGEPLPITNADSHLPSKNNQTTQLKKRRASAKPSFLDETQERLPLSQRSGNGHKTPDSGKWFTVNNNISHRPGLFEKAKQIAASASPFSRREVAASIHNEQDDELQRDVRDPSGQDVTQEPWHQRWAWLRQVPSGLDTTGPENGDETESESVSSELLSDAYDEFRWWQLFNPYTYFQALLWAATTACDSLLAGLEVLFPQTARDGFMDLFGRLLYVLAFCVGFLTIAGVLQGSFYSLVDEDFTMFPSPSRFSWQDVGGVLDKVHEYVPPLSMPTIPSISIPSISWPAWRSPGHLPAEWRLSLANISDPEEYFKAYTQDLDTLKANAEMHDASLQKLNAILPSVVHMELRNGQPVIAADFWHSLFELVKHDDRFVLFDKVGQTYQMKSEKQLKALAAQIGSDPMFSKKLDNLANSLENRLRREQSAQWAAWLRKNEKKVRDEQPRGNQTGNLVSKDTFLAILHDELAAHRRDIQEELAKMQPDLDTLVRDAAQMASQTLPEGMSRGQITTLVHSLVQKYIADVNLGAVAKGKIHAHWDSVLKHQINYAGVGSGAIVDKKHSSESYKRPKDELSKEDQRRGLAVEMTQPQIAALLPWREDGDCWCARRSKSRRGNPHGAALSILLSQQIIPQYLAIEHILPWATVDPGARPKNIEVYADVDESVRSRLRDFASTHFPDDTSDWDFTPPEFPERFVKIGQFTYKDVKRDGAADTRHKKKEDEELPDEVQVFHFSPELTELGLETDQIIVRATSNYGAKDHTCFYRVRLFGKAVDDTGTWEQASS